MVTRIMILLIILLGCTKGEVLEPERALKSKGNVYLHVELKYVKAKPGGIFVMPVYVHSNDTHLVHAISMTINTEDSSSIIIDTLLHISPLFNNGMFLFTSISAVQPNQIRLAYISLEGISIGTKKILLFMIKGRVKKSNVSLYFVDDINYNDWSGLYPPPYDVVYDSAMIKYKVPSQLTSLSIN